MTFVGKQPIEKIGGIAYGFLLSYCVLIGIVKACDETQEHVNLLQEFLKNLF
jgi:hypothetical protein